MINKSGLFRRILIAVDVTDVRWKRERSGSVVVFSVIIILSLCYAQSADSSFAAQSSEQYRPKAVHLYTQKSSAEINSDGTKVPELPGGGPCKIVNRRINREQSIMPCPGISQCVIPDPHNDPESDIEVFICSDEKTVEAVKVAAAMYNNDDDKN